MFSVYLRDVPGTCYTWQSTCAAYWMARLVVIAMSKNLCRPLLEFVIVRGGKHASAKVVSTPNFSCWQVHPEEVD